MGLKYETEQLSNLVLLILVLSCMQPVFRLVSGKAQWQMRNCAAGVQLLDGMKPEDRG